MKGMKEHLNNCGNCRYWKEDELPWGVCNHEAMLEDMVDMPNGEEDDFITNEYFCCNLWEPE